MSFSGAEYQFMAFVNIYFELDLGIQTAQFAANRSVNALVYTKWIVQLTLI